MIPLVEAIEKGKGQTESLGESQERCGVRTRAQPNFPVGSGLEWPAVEDDSSVRERKKVDSGYPEYQWLNIHWEYGSQ